MAVLTVFELLRIPFPLSAMIVSAASVIGVLASAWTILRLFIPRSQAVCYLFIFGAIVSSSPSYVFWSLGGLETTFYSFLCIFGLASGLKAFSSGSSLSYRQATLVGANFALIPMTRVEGILFFVAFVIAGAIVLKSWRNWIWVCVGFLAIASPFALWKWHYYGSLIPIPSISKSRFNIDIFRPIDTAIQAFRLGQIDIPTRFIYLYMLPIYLSMLCIISIKVKGFARVIPPKLLQVAFWTISAGVSLSLLSYLKITHWMPGFRYYTPFIPLIALLATLGIYRIFEPIKSPLSRMALIAILTVCGGTAYVGPQMDLANSLDHYSARYEKWLDQDHRQLGIWINQNTSPNASIAIYDAGIAPYLADRLTIDLGGLCDPFIALSSKNGSWSKITEYVFKQLPDVIVLSAISEIERQLASDIKLEKYYNFRFTTGVAESMAADYHLNVFTKKSDLPLRSNPDIS